MKADIDKVLISHAQISARIIELAGQINGDLAAHPVPDANGPVDITIVPILTGAMIFAGDLIRRLPLKMRIGLITVSSYPGASLQSQGSQVIGRQLGDIRGRQVLLVDDILDSGGTIRRAVPILQGLGAAAVRTCVLLRKDRPSAQEVRADYVGFEIPDVFVVGYGLDYNDYYRNLPDIVTLKPQVYAAATGAGEPIHER
jgi:hypoxanthine phosphoribosyltransferase